MNDHENAVHEANLMRSIARLDTRFEVLHQDVVEVKGAMHKLADAITKLAVIEERQSQVSSAVERAFAAINLVTQQVAGLEVRMAAMRVEGNTASKWVDRALVALIAAGVGTFFGKLIS